MDTTPEQVINSIKRNGTFDAMRQEMFSHYMTSDKGMQFKELLNETLESIQDRSSQLFTDSVQLEKILYDHLNRKEHIDRVSREARIHWLANKDNRLQVSHAIKQAIGQVSGAQPMD
ncbi:hypothetical protein H4219_006214 [Mycoemilia scoparia]|uniref:BOD1/SHG1 domain-containing protein n=1 Tax=Mycoemilia scoparia TaxID=417184 RepID=A0A9W7ZQ80_9FUNG|nr:hypothetical protein H4219_006214 [Mycoemilia scoparia]